MNDRLTIFSPDRAYRYTLWREFGGDLLWDGVNKMAEGYVMWIGLNPSTADETRDDPTIRKCIGFTKRWHFGAMVMTNLFAFRATDPRVMKGCPKPIGNENDKWLTRIARDAAIVVAAWGNHGQFIGRDKEVMKLLDDVHCLRITGENCPQHPLYVPYATLPVPYEPFVVL